MWLFPIALLGYRSFCRDFMRNKQRTRPWVEYTRHEENVENYTCFIVMNSRSLQTKTRSLLGPKSNSLYLQLFGAIYCTIFCNQDGFYLPISGGSLASRSSSLARARVFCSIVCRRRSPILGTTCSLIPHPRLSDYVCVNSGRSHDNHNSGNENFLERQNN